MSATNDDHDCDERSGQGDDPDGVHATTLRPREQWSYHDDGHWWDDWNTVRDDDPTLGQWDVDAAEAILFDGYCACGSPEIITELMKSFLTLTRHSTDGKAQFTQIVDDEPLDLALAYWADRRRLTEHGGSVYGAWITPAGRRWLELATS